MTVCRFLPHFCHSHASCAVPCTWNRQIPGPELFDEAGEADAVTPPPSALWLLDAAAAATRPTAAKPATASVAGEAAAGAAATAAVGFWQVTKESFRPLAGDNCGSPDAVATTDSN